MLTYPKRIQKINQVDKKHKTKGAEETQKLGKELAEKILKQGPKSQAMVLALCGNLGGGKTTFLQGFAKGLGIKDKILSPTFVIMKRFKNFYHVDCYRLNSERDAAELGLKEIIANPNNIVAIEWPERIKKLIPKSAMKISFKLIDETTREINFKI